MKLLVSRQNSGEDNDTTLQHSCLENPMDAGAWWAAVHGVAKSRTGLSDFTSTFHFHALEKEMATHSSVLAWRIPGTGEPAGLPSMGSHRVGHDWSDLAAAAGEIPGRFLAQPCLKALFHPFFQSAFNSERMDPVRGNLMGKELMLMLHGNYLPS